MNRHSHRGPALLSLGWGMLWGVALGMWSLAPKIIETHRIRPDGATQSLVVIGGLTTIFAIIGAYISFLGSVVLVVIDKKFLGGFRDRTWAYGLFSSVIVVATYALVSFLSHWMSFRSLHLAYYLGEITAVALFCLVCLMICTTLYKRMIARTPRPRPSVLAWMLVLVALSGALLNLLPASAAALHAPEVPPLKRVCTSGWWRSGSALSCAAAGEDTPLLFIGLDGGTWRLLDRAMQNGDAPTFRDLLSHGTAGTVEALWPPHWSGAAWAAILTGLPREVNGVYENLAATGPGLPIMQVPLDPDPRLGPFYGVRALMRASGLLRFTPPPRALLQGKPIWQLLHEADIETAVVRFRFTYPPEGQAAVVVSDRVGRDQWESLGVRWQAGLDTVTPANRAEELLAPFRSEAPSDPALFDRLLPGPVPQKPADALLNPIQELRIASDIDDRTFNVSEAILRKHPKQPFLAVYIGGLDSVEHAFWPYRFPEDFPNDPPAQHDIERLGPVLDRYVSYLDDRLRRLLALYATRPNVLIVSDHGHGAASSLRSWRGWHTKDGIFLAAGPSVPRRTERTSVSYYDILPTIAGLKGFQTVTASTPAFHR